VSKRVDRLNAVVDNLTGFIDDHPLTENDAERVEFV